MSGLTLIAVRRPKHRHLLIAHLGHPLEVDVKMLQLVFPPEQQPDLGHSTPNGQVRHLCTRQSAADHHDGSLLPLIDPPGDMLWQARSPSLFSHVVKAMAHAAQVWLQLEVAIAGYTRLGPRTDGENDDLGEYRTFVGGQGEELGARDVLWISIVNLLYLRLDDEVLQSIPLHNVLAEAGEDLRRRCVVIDAIAVVDAKVAGDFSSPGRVSKTRHETQHTLCELHDDSWWTGRREKGGTAYFARLCLALCLLISLPTTLWISRKWPVRCVKCEKANSPSRSLGSGWKNNGLRRWSICRWRNRSCQADIHWVECASITMSDLSVSASSSDSRSRGVSEGGASEGLLQRRSLRSFSIVSGRWKRRQYRACSSSVKSAEGVDSRSLEATARPHGPAPTIAMS